MSQIGDCLSFGFFDMSQYAVRLELLLNFKEQLLRFGEMTAEDIHNIWTNDIFYTENDAEYMVGKFEEDKHDPIVFYASDCIVGEQKHLLLKYFNGMSIEDMCRITTFLRYTKYSLGAYSIDAMFGNPDITKLWRKLNTVDFFFGLTFEMQTKMVDEYNLKYDEKY